MARHVIKYEYDDNGVKMKNPESWCGIFISHVWKFNDAQHVALASGGSVQPCKRCIKAIIKNLEAEL